MTSSVWSGTASARPRARRVTCTASTRCRRSRPASTNLNVTLSNEWFFRTVFDHDLQARILAHYVKSVLAIGSVKACRWGRRFGTPVSARLPFIAGARDMVGSTLVSRADSRVGRKKMSGLWQPIGAHPAFAFRARGAGDLPCRRPLLYTALIAARVRERPLERRLITILAADLVGYSRLMAADEEGTIERLLIVRAEVVDPAIAAAEGRVVKTMATGCW